MENDLSIDSSKSVVFVGLACVDVVNVVQTFPKEDDEHRCLDYFWQRGGNASNSSSVFSLLGGRSHFFGTLAGDTDLKELSYLRDDFAKFNVNIERCVVIPDTFCPTSTVILNKATGSRTLLSVNKNLPELKLSDFQDRMDISSGSVGWIHFEGRNNAEEIAKMMRFVNDFNASRSPCQRIITSLEAEKIRLAPGLEMYDMWKLPDVMFVSKDFAAKQGHTNMETSVMAFHKKLKPGAILICAWGDKGAAAMATECGIVTSPAFPPEKVVDTCGAGDTFNAATIYALSSGRSLKESITFACRVAGYKCGIQGYEGVKNLICGGELNCN